MSDHTFLAVSDKRLPVLIGAAQRRVILAIPALHETTGRSLIAAHRRLGGGGVRVVIDCSEKVFRLGYGRFDAIEALVSAGCDVRQSAGLRVGVLIVDDRGWLFAPAALYVEDEVHSDETPNAVCLHGSDVEALAASIAPEMAEEPGRPKPGEPGDSANLRQPEVGIEPVTTKQMARVGEGLSVAPPVPFDIARQVHVFEPYLQYVEISLRGCAIQKHRVQLPKSILAIDSGGDIANRLRTTFDLIEKSSAVSSEALDKELLPIRENFTKSIGKPWGRVMLKSVRPRFDQVVAAFRVKLKAHEAVVRKKLQSLIDGSKKPVVEAYLPLLQKRPPDALLGQIMRPKPTVGDLRQWLDAELKGVFPTAGDLVDEMALDVTFRDVTFETLNETGFREKIQDAFPMVDWDKPFEEFIAAKEKGTSDV
jgi:hypothetical protein